MKDVQKQSRLHSKGREKTAISQGPDTSANKANSLASEDARRLLQLIDSDEPLGSQSDNSLRKLAAELVSRVEARAKPSAGTEPHPKGRKKQSAQDILNQALSETPKTPNRPNLQKRTTQSQERPGPVSPSERSAETRPLEQSSKATIALTNASWVYGRADQGEQKLAFTGSSERANSPSASPQLEPSALAKSGVIKALALEAKQNEELGKEHPYVVAMALKDFGRREQASALRTLPRDMVRVVQRLLI